MLSGRLVVAIWVYYDMQHDIAADSMVAWSCKLNVFNTQFVRFSRIITDVQSFKTEVVQLLVEMIRAGYPHVQLLYRCRRRCKITPVLFGVTRGDGHGPHRGLSGLFPEIKAAVPNAIPDLN